MKLIKITRHYDKKHLSIHFDNNVSVIVSGIIENVRKNGDEALKFYEKKFDGVELQNFKMSENDFIKACNSVGKDYFQMLERCADNIRQFHECQKQSGYIVERDGVLIGQRVLPIESVALYVPGGSASYPSTVLMTAIPAKIAGCPNIFIITPPPVKPEVIAAASAIGIRDIFTVGGAQAIAASAFGTVSVKKADKIFGPGNIYVTEAKRQVNSLGLAAIDNIAGPSEILIIADRNADPNFIAADLLAQAEHDANACSVLITTSEKLAQSVSCEIEKQIQCLSRREIARSSIDRNGVIIVTESIDDALKIADDIAPEHLELFVDEPFDLMPKVKNAGSIFLGKYSPEAIGDYFAGSNHTLPTMGTARFASPLSVNDFVRKSQFIYYSPEAFNMAACDVEKFALSEGLTAHANSVTIRKCTPKIS